MWKMRAHSESKFKQVHEDVSRKESYLDIQCKIIVIYKGMERAPDFLKEHLRASKRQKNSSVPPLKSSVFFKLFKPTKSFSIL